MKNKKDANLIKFTLIRASGMIGGRINTLGNKY